VVENPARKDYKIMGRHNTPRPAGAGTGTGGNRGSGFPGPTRVWTGRAALIAAGVSSVMGAGAGLAAATPSLNDAELGNAAITDEYDGPSLIEAPSASDAPKLNGASLDGVSFDRDSPSGESVRGELSGSALWGESEVSGEDAAASSGVAGGSAHGSMSSDGGPIAASAPNGAPDEFDELG